MTAKNNAINKKNRTPLTSDHRADPRNINFTTFSSEKTGLCKNQPKPRTLDRKLRIVGIETKSPYKTMFLSGTSLETPNRVFLGQSGNRDWGKMQSRGTINV